MTRFKQLLVGAALLLAAGGGWYAYSVANSGGPAADAEAARGGGAGGTGGHGGRGIAGLGGPGGSVNVITAPVTSDDAGETVTALGTAKAVRSVAVTPQVTGIVADIGFQPGTRVEAGAMVVRLEDDEQQVAVDRARVALEEARAALARSKTLASSRTISSVALSDAETAAQMAEIELRSAEIALDRRTIRAPFAGRAGLSDVVPGNLVTTATEIVRIEDVSTIQVAFEVPERWSGRIAAGRTIAATAEGLPGQDFAGEVAAIDSRVDQTTRTLRMEATLGNEGGLIKPGMAILVRLEFAGEDRIAVPALALQWDRKGSFVWRFAEGAVTRVPVAVLSRRSGEVVVKAELQPGDAVVVEGVQRLREGMKATLVGRSAPEAGAGPDATPDLRGGTPAISRTDTPPARS